MNDRLPRKMTNALLALGFAAWLGSLGNGIARAEGEAAAVPCHGSPDVAAATTAPAPPPPEVAAGRREMPDPLLTDQDGRPVRVYRDLVQGRLVAVNFIFTTCSTICPPMGANFAKLERLLAERQGLPVALISISIDPATDTPARLKAWRETFRGEGARGAAGPWTLVTGPRQDVTALLKALRAYTPDKTLHTPFLLLGNDATGQWRRVYGLTPPAELAKLLDELATPTVARASTPAKGGAP